MLSNIWVNIVCGNGLAPNDTAPLTDPTLNMLNIVDKWCPRNIYKSLTVIRIITVKTLEIIYDNHFNRGQWVYVFGLMVAFRLLCLKILCINQHICWHIKSNIDTTRTIISRYNVWRDNDLWNMQIEFYNSQYTPHTSRVSYGWICANIWGKITILLGGPTVYICVYKKFSCAES